MSEEDSATLTENTVRLHFLARPILQELSRLDLSGCLDYSDENTVLAGGFADVIRGRYACAHRGIFPVAIKRLRFYMKTDIKNLFEKEIYVWSKLKHPNILPLLGYDFDKMTGYPLLISEWMDNGSISAYVKSHPEANLLQLVTGIARGLAYLHEKLVVHSDIKSDNILVSINGAPLICDFGGARIMAASRSLAIPSSTHRGTYCYLAHELLSDVSESSGHTFKSDVWAFGMTVFELLSWERPYSHLSEIQVIISIQKGELPTFSESWPRKLDAKATIALQEVCRSCWIFDPSERPDMDVIVKRLQLATSASLSGPMLDDTSNLSLTPTKATPGDRNMETGVDRTVSASADPGPRLDPTTQLVASFAQLSQGVSKNGCIVAQFDKSLPQSQVFDDALSELRKDDVQNTEQVASLLGRLEAQMRTNLSIEIMIRIFALLDYKDLISVSRLNHFFRDIVGNYPELQYSFALQVYGMLDGDSSLDIRYKLEELERRERAWRSMDLSRKVIVKTPFQMSPIYDLSRGVFALRDNTQTISFFDLNTSKTGAAFRDEPWRRMELDAKIVGFGLGEPDLVAVVGIKAEQDEGPDSVVLYLREISTFAPHPLAHDPDIIIGTSNRDQLLEIKLEIVGPRLMLLIKWCRGQVQIQPHERAELLLFNWREGTKIMSESSPQQQWGSFTFLSPEFVVLPDHVHGLEVLRLPDITKASSLECFERVLRLSLPNLRKGYQATALHCRPSFTSFEPWNSTVADLSRATKTSQRTHTNKRPPVTPDPTKSIILIKMYFCSSEGMEQENGQQLVVSFVIHRESVLQLMDKVAGQTPSTINDFQKSEHVPTIPWKQWDPYSRWMAMDRAMTFWTATAGQRLIASSYGHIVIRDFNPITVRRAPVLGRELRQKAVEAKSESDTVEANEVSGFQDTDTSWKSCHNVSRYTKVERIFLLPYFGSEFQKPLKCVEYMSLRDYDYDEVILDDERIIALRRDEGNTLTLDVFTL